MAGELVLVTGAAGFLGFRTILEALRAGYRIRGTVRRDDQITKVLSNPLIAPFKSSIEVVIVEDITAEGAFDHVLDGVTYILHIASPLAKPSDDLVRTIVEPAVHGTTSILTSATKFPGIKRVVITSSNVVLMSWAYLRTDDFSKVFTEKDVYDPPTSPYSFTGGPFDAYMGAKSLAFAATNKFVEERKPAYDIVNIMPSFLFGRNELAATTAELGTGTNGIVLRPLQGVKGTMPLPSSTVHVDDVAYAHVAALDPKIPGGENFMLNSGGLKGTNFEDSFEVVKKYFPEAVEAGILRTDGAQPGRPVKMDTSKAEKTFGIQFRSYEEQVKDVAGQYVDLVKAEKAN